VTFRPHEHIRRRADFESIYQSGVKVSGRLMTMFVRPNAGEHARLGIAATRKIGGAVVRNRAKRLSRDIVVIPRREFLDASYSSLQREFDALLERAAKPGRPRSPRAHSRV
jgi:ribonuclease P protein component